MDVAVDHAFAKICGLILLLAKRLGKILRDQVFNKIIHDFSHIFELKIFKIKALMTPLDLSQHDSFRYGLVPFGRRHTSF